MNLDKDLEPDIFVVFLLKSREGEDKAARELITRFEKSVRMKGGMIQMKSSYPKNWSFLDGFNNYKAPNAEKHLTPAVFDMTFVMVGCFPGSEKLHTWWSSDEVFSILKVRGPLEKIGIYAFDGLQKGYDIKETERAAFDDKFILLEFMQMQKFKPVQHYVDCYKRYAERAVYEIGIAANLLFAEGVTVVLMNEFPLDACCATSWQHVGDASFWYDAEIYQKQLFPYRRDYAVSLSLLAPLLDDPATGRSPLQPTGRLRKLRFPPGHYNKMLMDESDWSPRSPGSPVSPGSP